MTAGSSSSGLRVLDFPVHVRSGFVVFMVLIAVLYGSAYGLWLAGALAVFTLLHELGHAVVARWAGAEAEISLEFMAGYAAYRPTRPIRRPVQAAIALAGPITHIATGVIALAVLGHQPFQRPDWDSTAAAAIWWAGPVIGLLNLIPVLPLDGGHVVQTGLEAGMGERRARQVMLYASLAITLAFGVWLAAREETRFATIFLAFLVLNQLQGIFADRDRNARSPFDRARDELAAGRPEKARRMLINGVRRPGPAGTTKPMDRADAERLIALLPVDDLPHGNVANEYQLANLLLGTGAHERAAHYAAATYQHHPSGLVATVVARAASALGDEATALAWLRTAAADEAMTAQVAAVIDGAPELGRIRGRPEVQALRAQLGVR